MQKPEDTNTLAGGSPLVRGVRALEPKHDEVGALVFALKTLVRSMPRYSDDTVPMRRARKLLERYK